MATIVEKPSWLTVKETALHEITVRRKIKAGEIPALQLGGQGAPYAAWRAISASFVSPGSAT